MIEKRQTNIKQVQSQMKEVKTELKDGVFIYTGPMTISEFALKIKKPENNIVKDLFLKGKMLNLNSTIDEEQIAELCIKYEYDFQKEKEVTAVNVMEEIEIIDAKEDLKTKAPIVAIMGHVDHGKTTLIDKIRNAKIAESEFGGITQHTSAYNIEYKGNKATFIDTPGHEAFIDMRSRGAKFTDIVVLVVAADDGVMPQTKEAIKHSKAVGVPMIVFVNKIDKQNINLDKVKSELAVHDVISEDLGGHIQFVYGSALTGKGIEELFKAIFLEAEMLELKANPNRLGIGVVIEAYLDKGRGSVATLIIENGTLITRDFIVAGANYGRIKSLRDLNNNIVKSIGPGSIAVITGLNYTPEAGERFIGFKDEKFAKNLAKERAFIDKQTSLKERNSVQIKGDIKILNIIVKADMKGTAEAVKHTLTKQGNEEVQVNVIRSNVGAINESDVVLAKSSNAIIYGFNIRPTGVVKQFAKQEKIIIKTHTIIYKMVEEVWDLLNGMKVPKFEEKVIGQAKIIKIFFSSKVGNIAGSIVIEGIIKVGSKMRLIRDGITIHEGVIDSLQRGKDQTKSVSNKNEFGTHIRKYNDIKLDDIIECYEDVEIKK